MISQELNLADTLLECFRGAFIDHPSPPATICMRVGEEVRQDLSMYEDECCDGLAYVKINQVYLSTAFPEPDATVTNCAPDQWAVDLEMGVFRCAPVGDIENVPLCEDWEKSAAVVALDAATMRRAIRCLRGELPVGDQLLVRQWQPIGPQGNCTGGSMIVTVSFLEPC